MSGIKGRCWPAHRRTVEYHIHVPDAESSESVVNRDFHGPTKVAQTNHKEIAYFYLPALRHGVGDLCTISLLLHFAQTTPHSQSVNFVTRTVAFSFYTCFIVRNLLRLLHAATPCLFLRLVGGGPSWIKATMVPRVKVLFVISVQSSLLLNVFMNRTEPMSKRLIPQRLQRLLQVLPPEASRDYC